MKLSDYTVGRILDRIHDYGAMKALSQISLQTLKQFNIGRSHLSFDTTSVNVHGDYSLYSEESNSSDTMNIVHGHSKDHRPDLKLVLLHSLISPLEID